eukprot:4647079-Heterocapsa_arctica.AAC.1
MLQWPVAACRRRRLLILGFVYIASTTYEANQTVHDQKSMTYEIIMFKSAAQHQRDSTTNQQRETAIWLSSAGFSSLEQNKDIAYSCWP